MARPGGFARLSQWFWATVILVLILGGCLLSYAFRDTEWVNPDIQQRDWLERKERR